MTHISFNRPYLSGKEPSYIQDAIQNNWQISGDGPFTRRCHEVLEQSLGIHKALITTSCTAALEMSALLLNIGPGDEVIVPSFTFVSTVNAFVLRGAQPVFLDCREDTLNLDENLLPHAVTEHTKAVVPVHYAGVGCEMDSILATANQHGFGVIEDNAHGLYGKYKGRWLGSFGALATLSFHETKNFTCGEGGALLINDPSLVTRAEIIREKGTNRSQFFKGLVDKYTWVDIGSSYLPGDLLAAYLFAQLEERDRIQSIRKGIFEHYQTGLEDWAKTQGVRLPVLPAHCETSYHMFHLILPTADSRDALMAYLKSKGITSVFHYLPLHLSPMGLQFGGKVGQCPVTEDMSARLLRLPFYNSLTRDDQDTVLDAVRSFQM